MKSDTDLLAGLAPLWKPGDLSRYSCEGPRPGDISSLVDINWDCPVGAESEKERVKTINGPTRLISGVSEKVAELGTSCGVSRVVAEPSTSHLIEN